MAHWEPRNDGQIRLCATEESIEVHDGSGGRVVLCQEDWRLVIRALLEWQRRRLSEAGEGPALRFHVERRN